jgi:hypothetical protein
LAIVFINSSLATALASDCFMICKIMALFWLTREFFLRYFLCLEHLKYRLDLNSVLEETIKFLKLFNILYFPAKQLIFFSHGLDILLEI